MRAPAVQIRSIQQVDNSAFKIEWSDGRIEKFHLEKLQNACPCASCEERRGASETVAQASKELRAYRLFNVGRYALRVEFTSGCSAGIYTYEFLYGRGEQL
jgi:DUF971 family protein